MDQHCDRNGFERVAGWVKVQIPAEQEFQNFQVFQVIDYRNVLTHNCTAPKHVWALSDLVTCIFLWQSNKARTLKT